MYSSLICIHLYLVEMLLFTTVSISVCVYNIMSVKEQEKHSLYVFYILHLTKFMVIIMPRQQRYPYYGQYPQ